MNREYLFSRPFMRLVISILAPFLLLFSGTLSAFPADPVTTLLTPSDAAANVNFGHSVAMTADQIFVGVPDAGAVYVFVPDGGTWVEQTQLMPMGSVGLDRFGSSVAGNGDALVVGAEFSDDGSTTKGSAYVFRFNGSQWVEEAKLSIPEDECYYFGRSVAIEDDTVVVGAMRDNAAGTWSGAAYVFRYTGTGWEYQARLLGDDTDAGDHFGISVDISGGVVAVGAENNYTGGIDTNMGSVYLFEFDGANWVQRSKLIPSDGRGDDRFGAAVAIDGQLVLVGAYQHDDAVGGTDSGSAYLFEFDGNDWVQTLKFKASDAEDYARFGLGVALDAGRAVIGAHWDDWGLGSAYVFEFDGDNWVERAKLTASDRLHDDHFGRSVAIRGEVAVVGVPNADIGDLRDSGAAYVFGGESFACVGYEAPMDAGAVKVKHNRALPLKARLLNQSGADITDIDIAAPPVVQVLYESGLAPAEDVTDEAFPVGLGTEGNEFEFNIDRWQYNLSTKNFTAGGTYTVTMQPGGPYAVNPTCTAQFVID